LKQASPGTVQTRPVDNSGRRTRMRVGVVAEFGHKGVSLPSQFTGGDVSVASHFLRNNAQIHPANEWKSLANPATHHPFSELAQSTCTRVLVQTNAFLPLNCEVRE
jgi:hypothetical protein